MAKQDGIEQQFATLVTHARLSCQRRLALVAWILGMGRSKLETNEKGQIVIVTDIFYGKNDQLTRPKKPSFME